MMPASNTPPQGDFVRYIERLTTIKAAAAVSGPAAEGFRPLKDGPDPLTMRAFLRHVGRMAGLWAVVKVLAWFVPGAGYLLAPLPVLYAAWLMLKLWRKAPGAFSGGLNRLAGRIAERVPKVQKHKSSHQP